MTDTVLDRLVEQIQHEQPRLFAIVGMYENPAVLDGEDPIYVEWGLEFAGQQTAFAWSPGSTTMGSSAEQILASNARLGPARLVWKD